MSDLLAELAAMEQSSAAAMTTAPAAAPVHMPEPVPGTTVNVTLALDGSLLSTTESQTSTTDLQPYPEYVPPVAPAAPVPEVPTAPAPEVPAAPVPNSEPGTENREPPVHIPDSTPRRVYTHAGMTPENKLLLGLIDANPGLGMDAILAAANTQLGRTTTQTPAPQAQPNSEPRTEHRELPSFDAVNTRLDEIGAQLETLDPVVDANEWKKLNLEHNKLTRQLPTLQIQQAQQQLTEDQQTDAFIAQTRSEVSQSYPQITPAVFAIIEDPQQPLSAITDPFAQAFAARYRQDQASGSPLLSAPDYESLVASSIAQQHGILPASRQPAPVATSPGAQAPAPTAAPAQRPAQPTMQQPGLAPVAAMPAISGTQHTSADRVTTQPANPLANVQLEYQQAVAANDFEGMERLSGIMASGGNQPQKAYPGGIIGISYSGGN